MKQKRAATERGRPREFDPDGALGRAMEVFWAKGYDAASLSDLTTAMGINRPSMYAAFGNKEQLFRKVLDRYAGDQANFISRAIEEPTARQVIQEIFRGAVNFLGSGEHPRGCLLVQGTPACGDASDAVKRAIIARRLAGETLICRRLKRAADEGELAPNAKPVDLAKFIATVVHGMAVQAASGTKRAQLQSIADIAISACRQWLREASD
jgi:AcrR family transcriptional regulator